MTKSKILAVLGIAMASSWPSVPAQSQVWRDWLLDVHPNSEGGYGAFPIALLTTGGGFVAPPEGSGDATGDGSDAPEHIQSLVRGLSFGRTHTLYRRGAGFGSLSINRYQPPGCSGFGALGGATELSSSYKPDEALAFSEGFPGRRTFSGSFDGTYLRLAALDLCRQTLAAGGVPAARTARCVAKQFAAFALGDGTIKACAMYARIPEPAKGAFPVAEDRVLLIAEEERGFLVPRFHVTFSRADKSERASESLEFHDVFDSNGQVDKVVLHGHGYEWEWYEIYQRSATGKYVRLFKGGGSGC